MSRMRLQQRLVNLFVFGRTGATCALAILALLCQATMVRASSWDPTLVVNTEAFQIIDDGNGSSNVFVQFGDSLGETLSFDLDPGRFDFSDDLHVDGLLSGSGNLAIEGSAKIGVFTIATIYDSSVSLASDDGQIYLGDEATNQTLNFLAIGGAVPTQISQTNSYFARDGGSVGIGTSSPETTLEVVGTASGSAILATEFLGSSGVTIFNALRPGNGTSIEALSIITGSGFIINEDGVDMDFRVESESNINMLFVDGAADRVGIGTGAPKATLDVLGSMSGSTLTVSGLKNCDTIDTNADGLFACGTDGGGAGTTSPAGSNTQLQINVGGAFGATSNLAYSSTGTLFEVRGTASGRTVHASNRLSASGGTFLQGDLTFIDGARTISTNNNGSDGYALTVQSGDAPGSGAGGALTLRSGDSVSGQSGNLSISTPDAEEITGDLTIRTGDSNNDNAGNIAITAGNGAGAGDGDISLDTSANGDIFFGGVSGAADISFSPTGAAVFNELSNSVNFRVEGNNDNDLISTVGSTDRVGIGTGAAETKLEVVGTTSGSTILATKFLGSSGVTIFNALRPGNGTSIEALSIITGSGFIINEDGVDMDFRVESESNINMLFVDGGANRVGIGTGAPKATLDVLGTMSGSTLYISGLKNCDTIDTNADGLLNCGTDNGGSGSPGGLDTYVQFNDGLAFGGDADYTWNKNTNFLNVRGTVSGSLLKASNLNLSGAVLYASGSTIRQSARGQSGQLLISQAYTAPKWADPVGGLVWYFDGTQATAIMKGPRITMPYALTLSSVSLDAKGAPTGAALIYDINSNGSSIFATRPQINAGATTGGGSAVFSTTNVSQNDVLTLDIDQVGSTFAGSGVTIILKGTRRY